MNKLCMWSGDRYRIRERQRDRELEQKRYETKSQQIKMNELFICVKYMKEE